MARRTNKSVFKTILHRLLLSRAHRYIISISRLIKHMKGKYDQTAIWVTKVTND